MFLKYNQMKELLDKLLQRIREHQYDWSELLFGLIMMLVIMLFLQWLDILSTTYKEHRIYYIVVWILTPIMLFIIKRNCTIFSYFNVDALKIIRVLSLCATIIISLWLTADADFTISELGLGIELINWHGWWVVLSLGLELVIYAFYYILIWSIPLITLFISHSILQMKEDAITRRST